MILKTTNLTAGYKKGQNIIKNISIDVGYDKIVGIIGKNGSGKSTLAKAIAGITPFCTGTIEFEGQVITGKSIEKHLNRSIGYFMQGGEVFPQLTLEENLKVAYGKSDNNGFKKRFTFFWPLFEELNDIPVDKKASFLSGGERHQLALCMVLFNSPKLLILDEPSAGLSPKNIKKTYKIILEMKKLQNISVLLIEQNLPMAFEHSDRVFRMVNGEVEEVKD